MPSTSQVNIQSFIGEFKKHIKNGKSVLYIGFSSALSGTVHSAVMAKEQLLEEYPNCDITVVDTKSASLGEGLLVYYACEMLKSGNSKEDIVDWLENNKLRMNHWFTVEDLNHLKRGGRISVSTAVIGTLLDIKPIMHVDDEGRLVPVTKVMGRKKSIRTLANNLKERIVDPEHQVIAISHGDCEEDAVLLKSLIAEDIKVRDVIINNVGPVIGSHSGPGTLALFFLGNTR
jgi:DegV family protein with EDD domain